MSIIKSIWENPARRSNMYNLLTITAIVLLFATGAYKPLRVWLIGLTLTQPKVITDQQATLNEADFHWTLRNLKGEPTRLEQYRGEVIFINFWATWCPPCVAELPDIQALYDDYGDEVKFLIVSSEQSEKLRAFLQEKNMDLPVYQPLQREPPLLASSSIPASFLIDKEGHIVIRKIGAANWNGNKTRSTIDKLLQ